MLLLRDGSSLQGIVECGDLLDQAGAVRGVSPGVSEVPGGPPTPATKGQRDGNRRDEQSPEHPPEPPDQPRAGPVRTDPRSKLVPRSQRRAVPAPVLAILQRHGT